MNKYRANGIAVYLLGKMQTDLGRIIGSQRQQARGFEKQMTGKARMAIGDAQEVIKNCLKREYPLV